MGRGTLDPVELSLYSIVMNVSNSISIPRLSSKLIGTALMALVLLVGLMPATASAQGRFGGRGFGRGIGWGLGWGLGFGLGSAVVYDSLYAYPPVVYTAAPPTIYYVDQTAPQAVVVSPAPAPVAAAPAPAQTAPAQTAPAAPAASAAGKQSRIVYDANGKPLGVLILSPDGKQEFVPLAQ